MATDFFPWQNPWRGELQRMMHFLPLLRPPALRRSLKEDWLFATDLPACAAPPECEAFLLRAREGGWDAEPAGGWINLRKALPSLPDGFFIWMEGEEAACLRTLLSRHPGEADPARQMILLMKAREEGPEAWERACRSLHQEFALRLRCHEPLPKIQMED